MIKTIIFDLSEVYLTGMKYVEHHLESLLNIPAIVIENKLHEENLMELFNGKITEDEYWGQIISKHQWDIDIEILKDTVRKNFKEIDGTRDIIEELKKRQYQLGLLSVHTKEWIEFCEEQFDYHGLFNEAMYSFQVAVCKPNLEAYKLILSKMNAIPSETLFIDDSIQNIEAAKKLGINTILFKNAEQLRNELMKMGLL